MSKNIILRIDFSTPVTFSVCVGLLRSMFNWWRQEVNNALPDSIRARIHRITLMPRIFINEDTWELECLDGSRLMFSMNADPYHVREELNRQVPQTLARSAEIIIPENYALLRQINIPSAATSRLRQVIRLQLDRLSPFRGDDVLFDCYPVDIRDTINAGSIDASEKAIEVIIVPKQRVFLIEQMLRNLGIVPRKISLKGTKAHFPPSGLPWTKQTQQLVIAWLSVIIVIAAALTFSPYLSDADINDLKEKVDYLEPEVKRALSYRNEIQKYQLPPKALTANRAAVLDLVLDLTHRLPDTIHLRRLEIKGDHISMNGVTTQPTHLESIFKRSSLLSRTTITYNELKGNFTATAMFRNPQNREH